MRVAGLIQDSIVDGPGLRFVVFAQGCKFCCEGCHNPDTWDEGGGEEKSIEDVIAEMMSNPLTDGLTLSGGEPFLQAHECVRLAAAARSGGLNVWIFTGYTFEELLDIIQTDPIAKELLDLTDVLIDGRFVLEQRTLMQKWRGSHNQRILDVKKSLTTGKAVEL